MVSTAKNSDRNNLIDLWREAFSEEACAVYFYDIVSFENIFVWRENGQAVSMLHFLPCAYQCDTMVYRGAYLYALATALPFRKKGIMGRLIEAALERAKETDLDFLCLAAANLPLCGYYKTFGFERVKETVEAAKLHFNKNIEEFVLWERMQETQTENTNKEKLINNQMICGLRKIPIRRFTGEIPY